MRLKQNNAYVEAEMDQARIELEARNARVVEVGALATKLEKQIEHSSSNVRESDSKRLFLNYGTWMLTQRLAIGVP